MQYKGFEIEIDAIDNDGYTCSIKRISDDWVLLDEWHEDYKEAVVSCKALIDDYYNRPEYYEDIGGD